MEAGLVYNFSDGDPSQTRILSMDKRLKLILKSHGLKRDTLKWGSEVRYCIPKADLYIDCRGVKEKGYSGIPGDDPRFQEMLKETYAPALEAIFQYIMESIGLIKDRRYDKPDPFAESFEILFLCAFGCNRSPAVKHLMAGRLRKLDYNVEVV